ncbi:hypothetical protein KXW28_001476 [Aspergillus fumigatus]|nr:hypothetical protein CNMCM8714_006181 [Aspergillus fumigatus]KAF4278913.1 hypothetical protein CNMCM8057_008161 [Aspergillus fumigatus]KAF4286858.1 hypothetical protein CNMCM8689_001590 [Aspergillus fumigatus]KAF4295099.1 hypothetical protein CNMCM8686_000913 [Aspergillus fumigatus]KAH1389511.1 hypothetical protein KXX10_000236 [Aspergillus fumigatus]
MANIAPQGVATHLSVNGLIGVTWTGAGLGIIFASIRFGIRIKRMKRLLVDDYFVLLALVFLVTNAILQTLQAPHLYYMLLNVTGPDIVYHALKYTHFEFVIIGIFWSVLWSIKGSFLALFWLISDGLPHYRRVWWGVTTFAVLAYIGCWLASILNCHPPSDYFRFGIVVVELWLMYLPLRILWKTKMNLHQKLGLATVFCLGFVIIAAAIIRAVAITGKAYSDQAALAIWGIAESSISMIVGCLPPFKSFITSGSSSANYNYNYNYNSSQRAANHYNRSASSARIKKRSITTTSWSGLPIPLQERNLNAYQNLEYESQGKHDVHIAGGVNTRAAPPPEPSRLSLSEDDAGHGEIRMVKEFSVVTSK